MAAQPRIDEPSMPKPSSKESSLSMSIGYEPWCQRPGRSVTRRSMNFALFFLAKSRTAFPSAMKRSLRRDGRTSATICTGPKRFCTGKTLERADTTYSRQLQHMGRRAFGEIECFYRGYKEKLWGAGLRTLGMALQ